MSLSFANTALELRWLRPFNLMAAISPMKLGTCWIGDGIQKLFPGLYCFPYAITAYPPSGGVLAFYFHGFVVTVTDMVATLSMEVRRADLRGR